MNLEQEKDIFERAFFGKIETYFTEKNSLNDAILYSLKAPAKRIRPLLCLGLSRAFAGNEAMATICGSSIEMIHTYSLIHDDLPAMDNDDYRRGQLTNHKVFGEALAILAGDSLISLAPEFLMKELLSYGMEAKKVIDLTLLLHEASGYKGMVLGQAMDMQNESTTGATEYQLEKNLHQIHHLKTAELITWSCLAGLYTNSDQDLIKKHFDQVKSLGQSIGVLFQMVDDLLDVTATSEELGKTPGKDSFARKLTFTNLYGTKKTAQLATSLIQKIQEQIQELGAGDWSLILKIIGSLEDKLLRA